MKILLVAVNSSYTHSNLAVRSLFANSKYNLRIYETNINSHINSVFEEITEENCDVLCFSCYIWNIEFIKKLAGDLKKAFPEKTIIFGGPEVSFNPKEYLELADYVICGEGEEVLDELLDNLSLSKNIKGVCSKKYFDSSFRYVKNLDSIKIDCDNLKGKIAYYESSRGCPYSCAYCLSGAMAGGVRFKSLSCVKKDISSLIKSGAKIIKFVDRTFNANEKRALEILKFIKENTDDVKFHFEFGMDIIGDEMLKLLLSFEKGKIQIEGGVQSTNEQTLCAVVRKTNLRNLYKNSRAIINKGNIHVHLDLIAGLPKEDYNSFKQSFNNVYGLFPHKLQLGFLKLLKGSALNCDYKKYGIVCSDYPPYEVIKTDSISPKELADLKHIDFIMDKYVNTARFYHTFKYLNKNRKNYFNMIKFIGDYFYQNGLISRPLSVKEQFTHFHSCIKNMPGTEDFEYYIALDYAASGLKGIPPEFIKNNSNVIKENIRKAKEDGFLTPHQIRNNIFIMSQIHPKNYEKGSFFLMCEPNERDCVTNEAKFTVIFKND